MIQIEVRILGSSGIIEPQPLRFQSTLQDRIIDLKSYIAEEEGYFPSQLTLYFVHDKKKDILMDHHDKRQVQDFNLQNGFFLVEFPVCSNSEAAESTLSSFSSSSFILVK